MLEQDAGNPSGPKTGEVPTASSVGSQEQNLPQKAAALARRVVQGLLGALGNYARQRGRLAWYLLDLVPQLRNERDLARELRIPLTGKTHDAWFNGVEWEVTLPPACAVCGEAVSEGHTQEDAILPDVRWMFWSPVVALAGGLILGFCVSPWLLPLLLVGGIAVGSLRVGGDVPVRLAVWRCLQHARRLELPQLRLFGKELIVRYGAKAPSRFFRAAAVEVPRESSSPLHERTELSSESQLSEPVAGHSTGLVPTSVDAVVPAAHDDHRQQTPIAPLEPIPLAQEPSSSESPVEQPAAPVARQLRVCPQCGKKLLPNESRCPACLKGPPAGAATAALRAEALRQPGRSEEQVARDALHMAEAPDSQYGGHAATIGLFAGHQGEVAGFAFPPQGGTVLSWTDSGELILWELGTRRIVERVPNVHMRINCAAFSPDGRRLLLAGEAEKQVLGRRRSVLALRDVPQWREIQRIDQAGNAAVEAWLSPDGRTAQTADELGQVRAWDLETGKMVRKFNTRPSWFSPRSGALVAFSPDGACAAVARPGGKLFLWDVASGKLRGQLSAGKGWWRQLPAHPGTINAVVFSSDGTQIVSASGERVIKSDYGAYGAMMGGLAGWLLGSLMGKLMDSSVSEAKATATTSIAVWNAETGKLRLQIPGGKNGHTQGIAYLSLSPDAARLVTSGYDGTCRLWDVSEARRAETLAIESGDGARRGIAATGRSLACWESSAWRFASDGEHAIASLATGVSVLKLAPAQQIELSTLPAVRLR